MAKWNVHHSGFYSYDVVVEAETEEEALLKADDIEVKEENYKYEPDCSEVWKL